MALKCSLWMVQGSQGPIKEFLIFLMWCCDTATTPRRGWGFHCRRRRGCWCGWAMGDGRRVTARVGGWGVGLVVVPLAWGWVLVLVGDGRGTRSEGVVGGVWMRPSRRARGCGFHCRCRRRRGCWCG